MTDQQIKAYGAFKYWKAAYRPMQKWRACDVICRQDISLEMQNIICKEIAYLGLQHLRAYAANYRENNAK